MSGRVFAGARALYRAAGVNGDDMGKKPIIAIANSFDEFLPGHVHLNKVGRIVSEAIKEAGGIPREFNTMAVDDGIAMGHTGMLYSLPSRDIIADTVEYQCNAHCADALICIPNCDKVVPGMLMAALRLNIPTVFVSGGPMEAGTTVLADGTVKSTDLIDVMYATADDSVSDEELLNYEKTVCPTCGSCAGMFTANSMNCLTEALGLSLPVMSEWSYPKLRVAPCRYWGSAYDDSLVILAHNYDRHFGRLQELAIGDPVQFIDADGVIYQYTVEKQEILEKPDVEKMVDSGYDLTLFTCTYGGRHRVTVRLRRTKTLA